MESVLVDLLEAKNNSDKELSMDVVRRDAASGRSSYVTLTRFGSGLPRPTSIIARSQA